ncbi:MAG TPA: tripartite tricarboxylate transporter substrate binding protein [Burkholderiales bacterium]|nr:tripartite tricarboxylate transporter substrate binding protein [Burkholderiales bacterium]
MRFISQCLRAGVVVAGILATGAALGQAAYPSKPIRLIVPFAPGGASDFVGRIIQPRWSELLGQSIVIENRAGASGNIGMDAAAKAAPDGYTLYLGNVGTTAINPSIFKTSLTVVPTRDFVPITQIVDVPSALVAHPSFPPNSARELIAYVKPQPGKFFFASPGPGSANRLEMERFMKSSGIQMTHVPYKGGAGPAITGLLGGETSVMFVTLSSAASQVRGGKLKLLAVAAPQRVAAFPNTPTLSEEGLPEMTNGSWQGVFAPAGTPPDIIAKLYPMLLQVMESPDVRKRLGDGGVEVVTSKSPEAFAAFLRAETERWAQVVKDSGATVD